MPRHVSERAGFNAHCPPPALLRCNDSTLRCGPGNCFQTDFEDFSHIGSPIPTMTWWERGGYISLEIDGGEAQEEEGAREGLLTSEYIVTHLPF